MWIFTRHSAQLCAKLHFVQNLAAKLIKIAYYRLTCLQSLTVTDMSPVPDRVRRVKTFNGLYSDWNLISAWQCFICLCQLVHVFQLMINLLHGNIVLVPGGVVTSGFNIIQPIATSSVMKHCPITTVDDWFRRVTQHVERLIFRKNNSLALLELIHNLFQSRDSIDIFCN